MEEKLRHYRAAKQRQYEQSRSFSEKIIRLFSWLQLPYYKGEEKKIDNSHVNVYAYKEKPKEKTTFQKIIDYIPKYVQLILFVLVWTYLWYFFIQIQFGAVYFVISLLIIMYFSMRTERDPHHLSAYSVFNPNCERIDGTFTAEQLEKELRFGPGSVH